MTFTNSQRDRIRYAYGHLAAAVAYPDDEKSAMSRELAENLFGTLDLSEREVALLEQAAIETSVWFDQGVDLARVRIQDYL